MDSGALTALHTNYAKIKTVINALKNLLHVVKKQGSGTMIEMILSHQEMYFLNLKINISSRVPNEAMILIVP